MKGNGGSTLSANIELGSGTLLRGNYVLLTADTLRLMLPQEEVGEAEYLDVALEASDEAGLLKPVGDAISRRFVALSEQMTLLPRCPPDRFLVTSIGEENDRLGWCWNEIQILINAEMQAHPLPPILLPPGTPVSYYVEFQGKLAYLCSAQQLSSFAPVPRK